MVRQASDLPVHLNEETLIWSVETGAKHQYPMPTIVGDVCLIGGDGRGNPEPWHAKGGTLSCRQLSDGAERWRLMVPEGGYGPATYGTCGVPVVQGDRVYVMSMHDVFCLDLDGLADGNDGMQDELSILTRRPAKFEDGEPTSLPDWAADVIWHYDLKQFNIKVQDATSCSVIVVDDQVWVSTANEIGSESRVYAEHEGKPHMVVLNKHDGSLIARDAMDVPIIFHGEWSSPSLIEVDGERAVIFPDGYGVLHAFAIPVPAADGAPVILEEYWQYDCNLPEWRHMPDGREIVYTLDARLDYKYPAEYYSNPDRYYLYNDDEVPSKDGDNHSGFSRGNKPRADGSHESVRGPDEIISMPAIVGNRIYIGIGRDGSYGLGRHSGRFLCLEVADVRQPPHLLWQDLEVGRTQCTASISDGLVYLADGFGMLNCWDAETGEVQYRFDLESRGIKERSQLLADDKIYICDNKGTMKVIAAGPEPQLLAEDKIGHHCGTIEAVDGLVLVATSREVLLYGDRARLARSE
ncbi:MAG: PQQ-binding-like beta-propeller repeat protein [Planctomycetota bacterium]